MKVRLRRINNPLFVMHVFELALCTALVVAVSGEILEAHAHNSRRYAVHATMYGFMCIILLVLISYFFDSPIDRLTMVTLSLLAVTMFLVSAEMLWLSGCGTSGGKTFVGYILCLLLAAAFAVDLVLHGLKFLNEPVTLESVPSPALPAGPYPMVQTLAQAIGKQPPQSRSPRSRDKRRPTGFTGTMSKDRSSVGSPSRSSQAQRDTTRDSSSSVTSVDERQDLSSIASVAEPRRSEHLHSQADDEPPLSQDGRDSKALNDTQLNIFDRTVKESKDSGERDSSFYSTSENVQEQRNSEVRKRAKSRDDESHSHKGQGKRRITFSDIKPLSSKRRSSIHDDLDSERKPRRPSDEFEVERKSRSHSKEFPSKSILKKSSVLPEISSEDLRKFRDMKGTDSGKKTESYLSETASGPFLKQKKSRSESSSINVAPSKRVVRKKSSSEAPSVSPQTADTMKSISISKDSEDTSISKPDNKSPSAKSPSPPPPPLPPVPVPPSHSQTEPKESIPLEPAPAARRLPRQKKSVPRKYRPVRLGGKEGRYESEVGGKNKPLHSGTTVRR